MGAADSSPQAGSSPAVGTAKLEVDIYQLVPDDLFKGRRPDGTGWDWSWADWRRDWMEATPNKFAYRCLPLTIANQCGWWIHCPVGITAVWNGNAPPRSVNITFDADPATWSSWVNDQFGQGILTWNIPLMFRTRPAGSRLLVSGPPNRFKHGAQPLTALIESDWMYMSFTMNWKITAPGIPLRFEPGEPIAHLIPLAGNVGQDLEGASVRYLRAYEDPPVLEAYNRWHESRKGFRELLVAGASREAWQKDYFQGRDATRDAGATVPGHKTRLVPPAVHFRTPKP